MKITKFNLTTSGTIKTVFNDFCFLPYGSLIFSMKYKNKKRTIQIFLPEEDVHKAKLALMFNNQTGLESVFYQNWDLINDEYRGWINFVEKKSIQIIL
jgi:hypothetical protein